MFNTIPQVIFVLYKCFLFGLFLVFILVDTLQILAFTLLIANA